MKQFSYFALVLLINLFLINLSAVAQTQPNTLTPQEKEEGYQLLFDGKELSPDIWRGDLAGYPVENGVITCRGRNITTKEEFGDFIFRCEYKLPPGGNNGISIRGDLEIQVLDHHHPQYGKDFNDGQGLHAYQYNGSVYGVVPAKRNPEKNDYLRPIGEWNSYEIRVFGSKVKVILNDEIINDTDLKDYRDKPSLSGGNYRGLSRLTGPVGFLGHADPVEFRNIRIRPLKTDEVDVFDLMPKKQSN